MSYGSDDIYNQSEAKKTQENLNKVGVALWQDQNLEEKISCPLCRVKLIYQDNGRTLWCKECGKKTPVSDVKHEKKLTSRFPKSGSNTPIIISQKNKKHKSMLDYDGVNASLTDEDLADLRNAGFRV